MRQKEIFLELVQNDRNIKSFKMLSELVPSGCMPMPLFKIVKRSKISFPAKDKVSGERYRTVGPLVTICETSLNIGTAKSTSVKTFNCP